MKNMSLFRFTRIRLALLCIVITMQTGLITSAQNYYPTYPNTDLSQLNQWTTSVTGIGGTNPNNFTAANQVFNVTNYNGSNNPKPTISANWTVSGAGSYVIVGDGVSPVNFIIPTGYSVTATINNIMASDTLTVSNLTGITWPATVDPTSTIDFLNLGSVSTIPVTFTYGSVIFDGTSNADGAGTFILAGNITLKNSGKFNPGGASINLILTGGNNQTLTGNGNTFEVNNFIDSVKVGGNTTFAANTNMIAIGSLQLHQTGITNLFSDGGDTITSGNNINMFGSVAGFSLTGTLILNGSSGTQKIDNNNKYAVPGAPVGAFNNLIIKTTGTAKVSFITSTANAIVTIKGSLVNSSSSSGANTLNTVSPSSGVDTFYIGGSLINNQNVAITYNAKTVYAFNGASPQTLQTVIAAGETFPNLNIKNSSNGGVTLKSSYFVSGVFNLAKGLLNTTAANILTLNAGSSATGGSATSYVNGPMTKKGNTVFTFPIGENGRYAPIGISAPATVTNAITASYTFAPCDTNLQKLNNPLTNVTGGEYWNLMQTASDAVTVTLWWENNSLSGIDTYDATLVVASSNGVSWSSNGQSAITGANTGNVTSNSITLPNSNGQISFGSTNIVSNPLLAPVSASNGSIVNVKCNGDSTGSATVTAGGGNDVYTYSWSPSGGSNATANNLKAGNYKVTVTDANGCSATAAATITEPSAITISGSSSPATCGSNNGSATATASGGSGGYAYSWTPSGGTNAIAANLSSGTYTVTVTDVNNCSLTASVLVTSVGGETVTVTSNNIKCNGGSDGSIITKTTGGTSPYTYLWAPSGATSSNIASLSMGCYTVTVTDANGCITTATTCVTQPVVLSSSASANNSPICAESCTDISVTPTGGTPGYSYLWNTGATTAKVNVCPLITTTYTTAVTDVNGCSTTSGVTVTVYPLPKVTMSIVKDTVCSTIKTDTLKGNPAGGAFSGPGVTGNNFNATVKGPGTYTLKYTYTDTNSCANSDSVKVIVTVCSGVNEITSLDKEVTFYPNPFNQSINVNIDYNGPVNIDMFNMLGENMGSWEMKQGQHVISTQNLPSGVYMMQVKTGNGTLNKKLIKVN